MQQFEERGGSDSHFLVIAEAKSSIASSIGSSIKKLVLVGKIGEEESRGDGGVATN